MKKVINKFAEFKARKLMQHSRRISLDTLVSDTEPSAFVKNGLCVVAYDDPETLDGDIIPTVGFLLGVDVTTNGVEYQVYFPQYGFTTRYKHVACADPMNMYKVLTKDARVGRVIGCVPVKNDEYDIVGHKLCVSFTDEPTKTYDATDVKFIDDITFGVEMDND